MSYIVAECARRAAKGYGLTCETERVLAKMAELAEPITHPHGNAHFQGFLLRIEGDLVAWVRRFSGLDIIYDPITAEQHRGLVTLLA